MTYDPIAEARRAVIRAEQAAAGCTCGCPSIELINDIPGVLPYIAIEHTDDCPIVAGKPGPTIGDVL